MTKDVLICIKGLHAAYDGEGEAEPIEVISVGKYFFRNGRHYVEYEEPEEESGRLIKNLVMLRGRRLEILRRGSFETRMIFEENEKCKSWYETPVGGMMAGFDVKRMQVLETENYIETDLSYVLELNGEPVAESRLQIRIVDKSVAYLIKKTAD